MRDGTITWEPGEPFRATTGAGAGVEVMTRTPRRCAARVAATSSGGSAPLARDRG